MNTHVLLRLHVIHTFQMTVTAPLPQVSCPLNLSRRLVCRAYFLLLFVVLPIQASLLHRLGRSYDLFPVNSFESVVFSMESPVKADFSFLGSAYLSGDSYLISSQN